MSHSWPSTDNNHVYYEGCPFIHDGSNIFVGGQVLIEHHLSIGLNNSSFHTTDSMEYVSLSRGTSDIYRTILFTSELLSFEVVTKSLVSLDYNSSKEWCMAEVQFRLWPCVCPLRSPKKRFSYRLVGSFKDRNFQKANLILISKLNSTCHLIHVISYIEKEKVNQPILSRQQPVIGSVKTLQWRIVRFLYKDHE